MQTELFKKFVLTFPKYKTLDTGKTVCLHNNLDLCMLLYECIVQNQESCASFLLFRLQKEILTRKKFGTEQYMLSMWEWLKLQKLPEEQENGTFKRIA